MTWQQCDTPAACHWPEVVADQLDWAVAGPDLAPPAGPHTDFQAQHNNIDRWRGMGKTQLSSFRGIIVTVPLQNSTDGKFLLVVPAGAEVKLGVAEVKSTVLRDSSTSCVFNFWVYLAGLEGAAELQPTLTHTELGYTTRLDRLDGSVVGEGEWSRVGIGLGRHRGEFQLGLSLTWEQNKSFTAGVAVDDVSQINSLAYFLLAVLSLLK